MRKSIYWAIGSCLLVLFFSFVVQVQQPSTASNYINDMVVSHQADNPIASPIIAKSPKIPVQSESVSYGKLNDKSLTGYISRPYESTKPLPALIVIHEWWGLNDNIKKMTDRLAGEGYVALAVDLYNGNVADNREQARELVTKAIFNSAQLKDNLKQAFEYLKTEEKAPKIASIGWCFGGLWSLNTALLLPEQLDATVIYYGGNLETDKEKLKPLQMPILGIFAALDKNPSIELVKQFETNLKALNKSVEIYIYDDVDHAFANPSGKNYNEEAAESAWQKTTAFLANYLN
jgi:carboxymethylenebutenolidase